MTVGELPTFRVSEVGENRAFGAYDRDRRWMGECRNALMLVAPERLVWGQFVNVNPAQATAAFVPELSTDLHSLRVGASYPWLESYWGERAELVLDTERHWTERKFEPRDAARFKQGDGYVVLTPLDDESVPAEAQVISGGWDHEHCDICWARISPHDQPIGMFSEPGYWICLNCYQQYVTRRSLGFISEGQ